MSGLECDVLLFVATDTDSASFTGTFIVLAGAEALARTTLGTLRIGKRVNLEHSLRMGDRLGGHWATGRNLRNNRLAGWGDANYGRWACASSRKWATCCASVRSPS